MAASYPLSLKSFLTVQDQPGTNPIVPDPDKPGSTVDLTIDRARITDEIHDEIIAIEQAIGPTGGGNSVTVIPGTTTLGAEINALFNGKSPGRIDPSNNAIYPLPTPSHNHFHSQLSGLDADDHTQYMRVDGARGFNSPVSGQPGSAMNHLATLGQVQGMEYLNYNQVEFVVYTTVRSEANYPCVGFAPQVSPLRYRMTGGYFSGRTDSNGLVRVDYSAAGFIGILTFVYMKMPYTGSNSGYIYQYEDDQLLLQTVDNQGSWLQFAEGITVDRQANVALSWMVVGV